MDFLPTELIRKKRFGGAHTREELKFLIQAYTRGEIPDYQMSAWLMAVCFQGLNAQETAMLTEEMRDSGTVHDLSDLGITVDKHSTGGIGDKTSLILAPLVAAAGVVVPMMAGRGLGHTGGTLDKLESLAGFQIGLEDAAFKRQLQQVGTAIIGQTKTICPADRKLYALRDVTGTVDSLPLICGSIMSKKLAEGMSALVLDVKFGSGAFMKTPEEAERLAQALMDIGRRAGKRVRALLTRMDEPLGRFVGNALEVKECVEIMQGQTGPGYDDTRELCLHLAAHMLVLAGKVSDPAEGLARARQLLQNGQAFAKWEQMCRAQGTKSFALPTADHSEIVTASQTGFLNYTNLEKIGYAGVHLRAGRKQTTDQLDYAAGIEILCVQGQNVQAGEPIFVLHMNSRDRAEAARACLQQAYEIGSSPRARSPLIAKVLTQ